MKQKRKSKKTTFMILLAGIVFILCLLLMRYFELSFKIYSNGADALDMTIGFDAKDVYRLLTDLGKEGRAIYIRVMAVDFIFIASFLYIQNYILKLAMGKLVHNHRWKYLLSVSYLRAIFDYFENGFILILIFRFPTQLEELAGLLSYITEIKFLWLIIWLISIPVTICFRRFGSYNGLE